MVILGTDFHSRRQLEKGAKKRNAFAGQASDLDTDINKILSSIRHDI